MKEFFMGWFFNRRKGKWSDLSKEERRRAKAFMYSAVAGNAIKQNADGKIEIEVLLEEKENGSV